MRTSVAVLRPALALLLLRLVLVTALSTFVRRIRGRRQVRIGRVLSELRAELGDLLGQGRALLLELSDALVPGPELGLELLDPIVTPITPHGRRNARMRPSWKAQNREWSDLDHLRVRRHAAITPVNGYVGIVRTVTATLTSRNARPVIDVMSIPAKTNEMGVFERMLDGLMAAYGNCDLFRLVTYDPGKSLTRDDAGACSKQNAQAARDRGLHYLMAIKSTQPTLYEEAVRWLGERAAAQAAATSSDLDHGNTVVRRLYIGEAGAAPEGWDHLRTVLRVEIETLDQKGKRITVENRYFVPLLHSWDFQGSFRSCPVLG